jgi:hypothetical protein
VLGTPARRPRPASSADMPFGKDVGDPGRPSVRVWSCQAGVHAASASDSGPLMSSPRRARHRASIAIGVASGRSEQAHHHRGERITR